MADLYTAENIQNWVNPTVVRRNEMPTMETEQAWTSRKAREEDDLAKNISDDDPTLRLKRILDPRRHSLRWAIQLRSAARIIGIDIKTLKNILTDPFRIHLETVRPQGNTGHRYLWLGDVIEYAKHMAEPEDV